MKEKITDLFLPPSQKLTRVFLSPTQKRNAISLPTEVVLIRISQTVQCL